MNILMLTSVYPQVDDGNEVVTPTVEYFCNEWVRLGHNVLVVHNNTKFPIVFYSLPQRFKRIFESHFGFNFPNRSSRKALSYKKNGVLIYRLPIFKLIPHGKFASYRIKQQCNKIVKILNCNNFIPDLILGHWLNPQIQMIADLKNVYSSVKTAIVFHNDCNDKTIKKFRVKDLLPKVNAIGCRNKRAAFDIKAGLKLERLPFICYSGVPDSLVMNYNKTGIFHAYSKINRQFIYVGRLVKYKRVDAVIKAMALAFPDKMFKLHIVGIGNEKECLSKLTTELGINDNVIFYGQMERSNVFSLMRKCDCFTMISEHETFGMVYLESMLMGCLTIASRNGGVDGLIIDGENGFLCEEGNFDELMNIYQRIDKMSEKQLEKIRHNAVVAASSFTDSAVAERYLNDVLNF